MTLSKLPPVLRRWRFLAAVMGVTALAGGGVLLAASSDPAPALAFHSVPQTRVLDTRPATQVGTRSTPLGLAGTLDLVIPGLPDDATAVNLNVTVVDGTEGSFLTVYPSLDARPTASTINWDAAGAVANTATVVIHSDHSVRIFNLKGTVNVVVDLLGYFAPTPVGSGGVGPVGPQGIQGIPGTSGSSAYSYASNSAAQLVLAEAPVAFADVGTPLGGITPNLNASLAAESFTVTTAGVYKVSFSIVATTANQVAIWVNGNGPGSTTFGADPGNAGSPAVPNDGTAVINLLAGDVVSLVNTETAQALGVMNLISPAGGVGSSVDAWILIERMS